MRKVSPTHIWGPVLILGAVAVSGVLFFSLGKSGEAALNSKFIEKVGEGFIATACGSSGVTGSEFICNVDGSVTARIHWYPTENFYKTECSDGIDNNGGGTIDMDDSGCLSPQDISEGAIGFQQAQCSDGIDNDGDGLMDYPADPGCINGPGYNFETAKMPQCSDGIDNGDGDFRIDMDDSQCTRPDDNSEKQSGFQPGECFDGIDNDDNLLTDYPDDPGCSSAIDPNEWNPISWCKYVNFFDDNLNVYVGLGTPCYLGATEGFLWPPVPQNFTQEYRVYASSDPTASGGHLFNEDYPPDGIVSFTAPSCVAPIAVNLRSQIPDRAGASVVGNLISGNSIQFAGVIRNTTNNDSAPSTARICIDSSEDDCYDYGIGSLGDFPIGVLNSTVNSGYSANLLSAPWTLPAGAGWHAYYLCADVTNTNNECAPGSPPCAQDSATDNCVSYSFRAFQCGNGVDDGDPEDTLADCADPGCHSDGNAGNPATCTVIEQTTDDEEGAWICSDGSDNDNDGYCDWNGCLASDGVTWLPRESVCPDPQTNTETTQCQDEDIFGNKIDNDDDGVPNESDAGCHTDGNPNNPATYDPNDNDERDQTFREIFLPFTRPFASLLRF